MFSFFSFLFVLGFPLHLNNCLHCIFFWPCLPKLRCRIPGRQPFCWGWRKSWRRKNWRKMILPKILYLKVWFCIWSLKISLYYVIVSGYFSFLYDGCFVFYSECLYLSLWFVYNSGMAFLFFLLLVFMLTFTSKNNWTYEIEGPWSYILSCRTIKFWFGFQPNIICTRWSRIWFGLTLILSHVFHRENVICKL